MHICCVCKNFSVKKILDFGQQAMSNRFLIASTEEEFKHPFCLGYCWSCGLVQLVDPPSIEDLKPRFDWIIYREPEGHLDHLIEILIILPGITSKSSFCGLGHYEDSIFERLRKKGFLQTWFLQLDKNNDYSINIIDTVQQYLIHQNINRITKDNGHPQVLIVRDILEHAHDPLRFMQALHEIVRSDGYVVFEVPDYSKTFDLCDYSSLWEEHISYFTPYTFLKCLEMGGFELVKMEVYPYDTQDYLIAIVRHQGNADFAHQAIESDILEREQKRIHRYVASYPERGLWYRKVLTAHRKQGKIALLGAGHLACHFINLMQVEDLIDFLVDDHPRKSTMFMPGSRLPIFSTAALKERNVKLCLLSVSPENEKKIINNKRWFIENGGKFASIFPTSQYPLIVP